MRTIFICHASEDTHFAERIQLALLGAGYEVFFDEQSLPPGGDYHARIERAIRTCDLFIFLITSSSIAPGKFTMTELKFARERWPSPVGRVLAINIQGLPASEIPAYLTAGTILSVAGNVASEVRASVEQMLPATRNRRLRIAIPIVLGVAALALALSVVAWRSGPRGSPMGPLEHGWNYDQNDLDPAGWLLVPSAEACSDLCYQRESCRAMTYVVSNRTCWLKSAVPNRTPNSDMISAVKRLQKLQSGHGG
jgi:hypothetical protein